VSVLYDPRKKRKGIFIWIDETVEEEEEKAVFTMEFPPGK